MKNTFYLSCWLGCILSVFISCSNNPSTFVVGVSQCNDDAWRQKMNQELRCEQLLHPDIELVFVEAQADNARQNAQIDSLVESGIDLLIVAPNEADAVEPAIKRTFNKGIPVVMADRAIQSDHYTSFIGGDNLAVGHLLGKFVQEAVNQNDKTVTGGVKLSF